MLPTTLMNFVMQLFRKRLRSSLLRGLSLGCNEVRRGILRFGPLLASIRTRQSPLR